MMEMVYAEATQKQKALGVTTNPLIPGRVCEGNKIAIGIQSCL
jgi:hypothetical protein